ncbi:MULTISPECIES: hypothetical protein [unclassified Phenylobacterium]|jgi:hypothetical protein|uniref:hypothetical protein n=1 Tax=unclassified Phenylobacterium TaxID=2640670 RepID=UPI00083A1D96|nr:MULTISPECIES: hypothetical protein [unclassified Phenylobacterium]MBJ7409727.1 hypothetical protein [Phenylobacterium sp.]OHB27474.1 MAG: hypothetical protein A2790_22000 [Phenylobacterium sp. RIFCSPHIGHO2_01_FULL_69_31]
MTSGVNYNHETVVLDGETFTDCEFRDCRLVYSGGPPPVFERCRFHGCDWKQDEAAVRTLAYLKALWNVGEKATVQALIKDITVAR